MMRSKVILVALAFVLLTNAAFAQENKNASGEKLEVVGFLLGSLGFLGLALPGVYGWGNFYAEDRKGFWVLNIVGSSFTICTLTGLVLTILSGIGTGLSNIGVSDPSKQKQNETSPLLAVGLVGSFITAFLSTIFGISSTTHYNEKVAYLRTSLFPIEILTLQDGIGIRVSRKL